MIRIVGANPALDRVSTWPPLELGNVNRAVGVSVVPGGKGINVARATARLGVRPAIHGFLGGPVGAWLRELLRTEGIEDRHTTIAAGTRVCFIVIEPDAGRVTVLNEPGPGVSADEVERCLDALGADCAPGDLLVLSGSLPDSVDPAVAGEVVRLGHAARARTIVDIHGEALRLAALARPWMLKCNRGELLELAGLLGLPSPPAASGGEDLRHLARTMAALRALGMEVVVVTIGADGALVADAAGVVHARVPAVPTVNPTGSGDLLLAGLVVGLERGLPAREAIILGGACGAAGATHLLPELPPGFDLGAWSARITLEPVEPAD